MSSSDSKVNILVVDDRPDKLLALDAVLSSLGENVVCAASGRDALRHVLNTEFAVILLDVNMPGMDGFETASLIRQRKSSGNVPIIFFTAMGDEMHVARGYSLGAVDYILTPVVAEVLHSKVAVFVELFRKTQQVRMQAQSLSRRAVQLQKLAHASIVINSALTLDKMLQTVTDAARDVIDAHQAITLFVDPRPGRRTNTQAFSSFSDKYDDWRNRPLQLDNLTHTAVLRSHSATRLSESEVLQHPDWEIVQNVNVPPIRGGMLAAPLTGRDGSRLGVIYLADRNQGPFTADDEVVAVQLAQMASIAVENALFSEEREANRIKDEFLSTLSHELRTPLNAIMGWTQILRMESIEGEIAHGIEVIERNAKAQAKLIEDLLDVSRIATGKFRLNTQVLALDPLIREICESHRPLAEAKKQSLQLDVSDSALRVAADPDRLRQVFTNLLSNAIKFTPEGGRVTVIVEQLGGRVRIRVTDSGRGIEPSFLPYVFERFRQADSTSTRSHGGLGIGLSIVRHIVELHGGCAEAESEGADRGSTFTITLPIPVSIDKPVGDSFPSNGDKPAREKLRVTLEGVRILVVDDESDARHMLKRILERAHAQVEAVSSPLEALAFIPALRPDVLVSDIAMPDMDGYTLIREIRAMPADQGGQTPAIALTAYAREEDRQRALSEGFQIHIGKPVEPAEIISAIARLRSPQPTQPAAAG